MKKRRSIDDIHLEGTGGETRQVLAVAKSEVFRRERGSAAILSGCERYRRWSREGRGEKAFARVFDEGNGAVPIAVIERDGRFSVANSGRQISGYSRRSI